ncbi:recombinase family protein [Guptibacillus hwajinpoensis]|uniref:recombinase family protein n=1 Tax=Guptibacillus hwajinpoensis TaxID=208199 RepID=UPI0024B3B072|nr:recombinase family protein [Pseudalkalibacillus hwajinpoensis]
MDYINRIKRVAIYLRKSRNNEGEETEETLQKHRKRLSDIAEKNNWKYELFQEVGSSMNENRPEYIRMLDDLNSGLFDAVLSVNLARVTRDDEEAPKFMKLLRREEILFINDNEKIFDLENQDDWFNLKVSGFLGNVEYENIKRQLRKGKLDSAKAGKWSNGKPNYGYIYNRLDRTLEIDQEKAKAVKLAYQLVIDGMGVDNIAIELNKLGYRTNKGNYFHGHSIKRIIEAPIYKGTLVSNKLKGRNINAGKVRPEEEWIVIEDAVKPCIIEKETWDLANEKLQERKRLFPRAKQRRHGLSSLIKCANCGKAHAVSYRKDRNNQKVIQPCKKKDTLGNTCGNRGFNYNTMLELIISEVAEHKQEIAEEVSTFKEDANALNAKTLKLEQINARISKVEKALDTLQYQLEEDLITIPRFKERNRARNDELKQLKDEYANLSDTTEQDQLDYKKDYLERLDVFLNEWDSLKDEKLNEGLSSFIEKINWYYPKEIDAPQLEIVWKKAN